MLKLQHMTDSQIEELVRTRPMAGGSVEGMFEHAEEERAKAKQLAKEHAEGIASSIDPYEFETPEQAARRGALTDILGQKEQYLGEMDPEGFSMRFDPMMGKLREMYGQNLRGYEESMSERGLMPIGSFAEGADQTIQPSSAYDTGRAMIEGQFAGEAGRIAQQAQAAQMAQQLQEYIALLSGASGLNVTPGQTTQAQLGIQQVLANMAMNQANINAQPDEPGLLEKVLIE